MIEVEKKNAGEFLVIVDEQNSVTEHIVTIDDEYYQKLTEGKINKEKLIEISFEFLLKREPKESVLSKFDLEIVGTYFPEYEKKIKT